MKDMAVDPKKLLEDAMELSAEQRADLAARLLESLSPPDAACEGELTEEVVRRAREVVAGTAVLEDWEAVRKDLSERFEKA